MVDPLNSLMLSAQRLANDSNISADDYVYFKNGKLHVEGRLGHAFTRTSTKAKTSQALFRAFTTYYGDAGREARSEFNRGYFGDHQLKVSDLRHAFKKAEEMKLADMKAALSQRYGQNMGDALASMERLVNGGGSVTQKMIGRAMDEVFGQGASAVVIGSAKGNYLESMPALMQAASEATAQIDLLRDQPKRVMDAIFDVCRRGPLTKASVTQAVTKHFNCNRLEKLGGEISNLPDHPTLEQVTKLFTKANLLYNKAKVDEFENKVVKDSALEACLGLKQKFADGAELTEAECREIRARLPRLKAAAKRLRQAAIRFAKNLPQASNATKQLAKDRAEEFIRAGRFGDQAESDLINGLELHHRLETNYDFGVTHEVGKHENWSPEQVACFRKVMTKIHDEYPRMNLFTEGVSPVAERVAKYVSGEMAALPADAAAFGDNADIFYIEALAMAGDHLAPMLLDKFPAIMERVQAGEPLTMDLAAEVCFGVPTGLANVSHRQEVDGCFEKMLLAFVAERLATQAERDDALAMARGAMPQGAEADINQYAKTLLNVRLDAKARSVVMAMQMGLSLEAALLRGTDLDQPLNLEDFAVKPRASMGKTLSREKEVANWCIDFQRQGEGAIDGERQDEGAKVTRHAQGATRITVTQSDGEVTLEHNGSEGLAKDEAAAFDAAQLTSKHQRVIDALTRLCGVNEAQCTTAISLLSQSGPVAFNRTFMQLVNGADQDGEHAPMLYHFSKRDNGDVELHMQSPEDPATAKLDVSVVIHPDGTHVLEAFSFLSPAAQQAANADANIIEPLI